LIIEGLGDEFKCIDLDLITSYSQSRTLCWYKGYKGHINWKILEKIILLKLEIKFLT